MISFLIRHKRSILIITLAFFIGSIVYIGLDAYRRTNYSIVAAKVGSQKIPTKLVYRLSENQATNLRNSGMDLDDQMMNFIRQQVLSSLISEEVLSQAAQKAGIGVSDYEVAYTIQHSPLAMVNGAFNKKVYESTLKRVTGMTPLEFENQLRQGGLANRFRGTLYSYYKLTPAEIKHSYKTQHGNMKDFEANKSDFVAQLMNTKMETAQKAFFDAFNENVEIKTYL